MFKFILPVVLFFGISVSAHASEDVRESQSLTKAQWWIIGTTGGLIAGSYLFTHQVHSEEPRQIIAVAGLVSFIGVSLYEDNKRKARLGLVEGRPSLLISASF